MNTMLAGSERRSLIRSNELMSYQFASKVKRAVADQIEEELYKSKLTKTILANRMGTSRTAINRLLDPENTSVTLNTLEKVAFALSKRLKIEFS